MPDSLTPLDFDDSNDAQRLLQPFWNRLSAIQADHPFVDDGAFLAALFEVPDSVLVRIALDDRRDLTALRLAVTDIQAANHVGGIMGGTTETARRVIETMGEEQEARGDIQRQEYILLGLLRSGGLQVRGLLAAFGIDRERVVRELPPEMWSVGWDAVATGTGARGDSTLQPALAHGSAIRLMDLVYERVRHGLSPSPEYIMMELVQLPYSPIAGVAMKRGFDPDAIRDRIRQCIRAANRDDPRREHNWSAECALVMSTALGLWRGRGELLLDHFALALLEVGGERVAETLASLEVTADRIREGMPRLGADM